MGVSAFSGWKLPHWWDGLLVLGCCYVLLLIEGGYQVSREALQLMNERSAASLVLGTELNDIRHKIDVVRSNTPAQYGPAFRLPADAWAEFDTLLAKWPGLYETVGVAYSAAHHLNEALDVRRGRVGRDTPLGVIPDDGLDEVYDAAGAALDALELPRRAPWESQKAKVIRLVAEDITADLAETERDS